MLDDRKISGAKPKTLFAAVAVLAAAWRRTYCEEMARRGFPWHLTAAGDLIDHLPPDGIAQSALVANVGLTKQAVQQLLDQLERADVIRRETDPADKRAKRIELTELGQKNVAQRLHVLAEIDESARTALGKKTYRKLRKALGELA